VGVGLGLLFEALDVSLLILFVGLAVLMAAEGAYYTRTRRSGVGLHRADAEGGGAKPRWERLALD
jgi:hypothetical protein